MVLKEELIEQLIMFLKKALKREVTKYTFLIRSPEEGLEDYSCLVRFLEDRSIPFKAAGVNLRSRLVLPSLTFTETRKGHAPLGLYMIYPDMDEEIILYLHQDMKETLRDEPRCIVGFRSQKSYEEFITQYRRYYSNKQRENNMIAVFGGHDIERPNLSWDDLILDPALKADIKWHVESFMSKESLYKRLNIPYRRGFLLTGPPGNGKTMLLKVIASNFPDWKVLYFTLPQGCDNDDIDHAFYRTQALSPSILCFEDLDTFFNGCATLSHFLNKLDGFEVMEGTLIFATTNHPENIDPALTSRPSRFDRVWVIDNPGKEARRLFIERQMAFMENNTLAELVATHTERFSMAYLKELCLCAAMLAVDRGVDYPGEKELLDSLEALSAQIAGAKYQFVSKVRPIGFGAADRFC